MAARRDRTTGSRFPADEYSGMFRMVISLFPRVRSADAGFPHLRVVGAAVRGAAAVVARRAAARGARARLARAHVQPLGAARAQRVHHQQDEVTVRDLLHAEWPASQQNSSSPYLASIS